MDQKAAILQKALELGYVRAGVASADDFPEYFQDVTSRPDYEFLMHDKRQIVQNTHLQERYPGAKSIISVVYSYSGIHYPEKLLPYIGRAYLGRCYGPPVTNINGARLQLLKDYIKSLGIRIYEEAVLPDRSVGRRAGTITYGRNNFAYAGRYGSFIILSSIVTDADLAPDKPIRFNGCPEGCRLCLDACPTQAIAEPFHLHPQRCVGFNNWFRQDEKGVSPVIPEEIRPAIGMHFHGCDICQEVCPRNKAALENMKVHGRKDPLLEMIAEKFDPEKLLFLDDDYYRETVQPIMFNYIHDYRYFRRNAALVMGNSGDPKYLPALHRAEKTEEDEMVREMIAWAIGRLDVAAPQISA